MVRKKIRFSSLFSQTWREYKDNSKQIFKFLFLFIGIPLILITIVNLSWIFSNNTIYEIAVNSYTIEETFSTVPMSYIATGVFLVLFYLFFYFFTMAGVTATSVQKKKYKSNEMIKMAQSSWMGYIRFVIVQLFFIFLLLLLLIIPGIIFGVYWAFAVYIFFYEKKGILHSLGKSKKLVKGHWWRVFGYFLLIIIMITVIGEILSLPLTIIMVGKTTLSQNQIIFVNIYQQILTFIEIVMSSFLIIFFKNFYFTLKNKK